MNYVMLEKDYVVRSEREMKSKIGRFFKEFKKHFGEVAEFDAEVLTTYYDDAKKMKQNYDYEKSQSISGCVSCREYEQYDDVDGSYLNKYNDSKCWAGWESAKDENGKKHNLSWDYVPADSLGAGHIYIYYRQRVKE